MRKYEKYKPSGIEWLGEIPEYWEVKRVKDLTIGITGFAFNSSKYSDSGIKLVRGINVKESVLNWNDSVYWPNISLDLKRFILKSNDVLIQMDGSKVGKNFCIVKDADLPLLLVQRVTRLRSLKILYPQFLFYSIVSNRFYDWVSIRKTDPMVPHITLKDIEEYVILFASVQEQTVIANYLDTKTAAIDRKIELLTAKADKYKALRRSLINETVCRGLNPNAPLKDSGIEWIGKIPEHWEEYRMKDLGFLFSGLSGKAGDDFNQDENENNCDFIPFTNIFNNDTINPDVMGKVVVFENEKQNKVKKNDLFFLMSSEDYDGLGKSSLLAVDLKNTYLNSFCKGFRITRKKVLPAFLNYQLQSESFRKIMQIEGKGFTRLNLKMEKVNDFAIYIPNTIEEQNEIVKYLNEKSTQIDTILTNISEQINKLTQLRKTLINDVVTGNIKVIED